MGDEAPLYISTLDFIDVSLPNDMALLNGAMNFVVGSTAPQQNSSPDLATSTTSFETYRDVHINVSTGDVCCVRVEVPAHDNLYLTRSQSVV